jgi:hypothetical protein
MKSHGLGRFLLALSTLLLPSFVAAQGCMFQCHSSNGCEVRPSAEKALTRIQDIKLWPLSGQCFAFSVDSGQLKGIVAVRGKGKPMEIDLGPGKSFDPSSLPKSDGCEIYSDECKKSIDRRFRLQTGGKNFDNVKTFSPMGDPCQLGLPCGKVLPRREASKILLQEVALEGTLEIVGFRSSSVKTSLRVSKGEFELPADILTSGANINYALRDSKGDIVTTGRFSVLSASEEKEFLADLKKPYNAAEPPSLQTISALSENELGWEIFQLISQQEVGTKK